jgi:hypothetical protein
VQPRSRFQRSKPIQAIGFAHGWENSEDLRDVEHKGCSAQCLIPVDHGFDSLVGLALQSAVPVNVRSE